MIDKRIESQNIIKYDEINEKHPENIRLEVNSTQTVKGKNENTEFQPNIKLLYRIVKAIMDNSSLGKTALSQKANINYVILMKHLIWLDDKGLIESIINDGKVHVRLREKGREFTSQLIKLIEGELDFINKQ